MLRNSLILHFGAVDYDATVYINGEIIGNHFGGYSSFEFDITDNVKVTLLQKEFGKTVYIKKRCQTVTNIQSDSAFGRVKK